MRRQPKRVPLASAALLLGRTYHQVRALLLRGDLKGGRDEFGRFYVDGGQLRQFQRKTAAQGRSATRRGERRHGP